MAATGFTTQLYRDPETGRERWAVLHGPTAVWYFAKRRGKRGALAYCLRLNRECGA